MASTVTVYEPAPPQNDVTDHLLAGFTLKDLVKIDWRTLVQGQNGNGNGNGNGHLNGHVNGNGNGNGKGNGRPPIRVLSVREVMDLPRPSDDDRLLGDLVRRQTLVVVGAETGAGKTTLMSAVASAVANRREFLDWCGNGARVLIADLEQGTRSVQRCIEQSGLLDAGDRVDIIHEPNGLPIDSDRGARRELEDILRSGNYGLSTIDPAYALFANSEQTDERKVREVMAYLGDLRREFGVAQILPAHTRKPPAGAKFTINEIFGSKAFTWSAETILGLRRLPDGTAELHWWKDREGDLPPVQSHWRLRYDPETGRYTRDSKKKTVTTRERIFAVLSERSWLTRDEIWLALGGRDGAPASDTIRSALNEPCFQHDQEKATTKRRWSLSPTLPGMDE